MKRRNFNSWLDSFVEFAGIGEAPARMYFWTGVSAIAGALRRQVWLDFKQFKWYPNFYIVLVAPPGIVSKSTTAGIGMDLLRDVPDVVFGPSVVTWQALVAKFSEATKSFELNGAWYPMSAMTLESSEFGNLLNPQDKQMIDLMVALWDGKEGVFEKSTRHSGNDAIENPWINMIACTTPSWIAGNFPEYMIGGGFCSRTIFVYADQKERYNPYPDEVIRMDYQEQRTKLVQDLTHIGSLKGEMKLSPEAREWGKGWYDRHYTSKHEHLEGGRYGGYLARKQTHIHKLAMVLSAAESDSLYIEQVHLELADTMVSDLEQDLPMVFNQIGQSSEAVVADRMLGWLVSKGACLYQELYKRFHSNFAGFREFENVLAGLVASGLVLKVQVAGGYNIRPTAAAYEKMRENPAQPTS